MKIALVSQGYPPETAGGGICTQTYMKAQGLALLGHEIFVISRSIDDRRQVSNGGGLTVIRIPGFETELLEMTDTVQWVSYSILVAAELYELHKRVLIDIVEFPEWGSEGYVHLLNRTDWNSIPTVIQLHGPLGMLAETIAYPEPGSLFHKIGSEMESRCLKLADALYSSSLCSAEWVRSAYELTDSEIPVVS